MMLDEKKYLEGMLHRTGLYFSKEDLETVKNSVVAIAGLGGVGAITAELMARWGVKRFRLLDMDRYEPSNLNRQLFATSNTLGRAKVDVGAERIKEINPFTEIEMKISARVNNENVDPFVQGASIVIQNADHPSCKLFYIAARKHKVPLVNGYAALTGGQVQTFDYRKSECRSVLDAYWQKLKFGHSKPLGEMTPEEVADFDRKHVHPTAPSINFVTNLVGCQIVAEAIKLLTGKGQVVQYPKYLEFDVFNYQMRTRSSNSPFNPSNVRAVKRVLNKKLSTKAF
jgi:molybdopterin/thiamine biosynthesis adenylyltransferase